MTIELLEAKEVLRVDNNYNDEIIKSLVEAVPSYIETTTGMTIEQQTEEPLAKTVGGFLIKLWYNAEGTDSYRLQQVIESLLKTLSFRADKKDQS